MKRGGLKTVKGFFFVSHWTAFSVSIHYTEFSCMDIANKILLCSWVLFHIHVTEDRLFLDFNYSDTFKNYFFNRNTLKSRVGISTWENSLH